MKRNKILYAILPLVGIACFSCSKAQQTMYYRDLDAGKDYKIDDKKHANEMVTAASSLINFYDQPHIKENEFINAVYTNSDNKQLFATQIYYEIANLLAQDILTNKAKNHSFSVGELNNNKWYDLFIPTISTTSLDISVNIKLDNGDVKNYIVKYSILDDKKIYFSMDVITKNTLSLFFNIGHTIII